jgi:hypothetical protein
MIPGHHREPSANEFTFVADDSVASSAYVEATNRPASDLMPLEAAAKAIFVRANGLAAYWKATGLAPRGS